MADTITNSTILKTKFYFVDGDDRTINIKNPRSDITSADIQSLESWMQNNQPLVGDKMQAAFGKILSAEKITTNTRALDI